MGSEAPPSPPPAHPNLVIHITGFKRFHGVDRNPTEFIMIALKEALRKKAGKDGIIDSESCPESFHLPPGIRIGSITVLEAAGYYALPALEKLLDSALTEKQQQQQQKMRSTSDGSMESDEQIVWIHLGVNSAASRFAIERQAINEATFRCADELGWHPQRERVVEADGELSTSRETKLPVAELADALAGAGFDVMVSNDAGRFVCNYVYYRSLHHASLHGTSSLFVHVPPFNRIDERTQLRFTASLIRVLASMITRG